MKILDFYKANCKNCYKCVRNCSVKAIKIVNDQAQIIEDKCIACGKCFLVCPQNARNIYSDLDIVLDALKHNKKIVVSIAPSYLGIYSNPYKLIGGLKKLGIYAVEETGVGAEVVTELYRKYIENCDKKNIITSCCPSVDLMIQKYYPQLIPYLIPVDSPMIVHSKMIKQKYGQDTFVTFIGPCISKKCEAYGYQVEGIIDAVLSFEEIEKWLEQEKVSIDKCSEEYPDNEANNVGKKYPINGGVLEGIKDVAYKNNYIPISVNGADNCKEIFKSIESGELEKVCIEANICEEGCIGGPAVPRNSKNIYIRKINIRNRIKNKRNIKESNNIDLLNKEETFNRIFKNKEYEYPVHTEKDIISILEKMGKYSKEDELNCGACGYDTCREKAKAVFEGLSHPEMCIPNMRSKAERLSNIIFEYSPNILLILDSHLKILDLNPEAEQVFMTNINKIKGEHISKLIDPIDFENVLNSKINILDKRVNIEKYNIKAKENIIYLPKQKILFGILSDITQEENKREQLINLRLNTLQIANNVIEKQMRVAQEIAGLLGETTAETKTALLKLKQVVTDEEGEIN